MRPDRSGYVTFTGTDACGNSSSTTATFTIEDTTAPTIDMAAADATVGCDGAGNVDGSWLGWMATVVRALLMRAAVYLEQRLTAAVDCGHHRFNDGDFHGDRRLRQQRQHENSDILSGRHHSTGIHAGASDQTSECEEMAYMALADDACSAATSLKPAR